MLFLSKIGGLCHVDVEEIPSHCLGRHKLLGVFSILELFKQLRHNVVRWVVFSESIFLGPSVTLLEVPLDKLRLLVALALETKGRLRLLLLVLKHVRYLRHGQGRVPIVNLVIVLVFCIEASIKVITMLVAMLESLQAPLLVKVDLILRKKLSTEGKYDIFLDLDVLEQAFVELRKLFLDPAQ